MILQLTYDMMFTPVSTCVPFIIPLFPPLDSLHSLLMYMLGSRSLRAFLLPLLSTSRGPVVVCTALCVPHRKHRYMSL